MRIVIDMQGAQSSGSWNRGIGRYTMSLVMAIVQNRQDHEVILALNGVFTESIERIRAHFETVLPLDNIKIWYTASSTAYLQSENTWLRQASEFVREAFLNSLNPDVVVITSLFEGLTDDAITSIKKTSNKPLVATILYDLIPYIHRKPYLENPIVEEWYLEKIEHLKQSNLLLAISGYSRQEGVGCLDFLPERCVNISTDADAHFQPSIVSIESESALRQRYGVHRRFIMYTGGIDYRKNIEGLIRAYAMLSPQLRKDHQLAIACSVKEQARSALQKVVSDAGLEPDEVILTGFVPEDDLIALYSLCELFVFPSLYEGFGLPALEAIRCGAPVIGSNTSSLPEVIGLPEALFNPHSEADIAQAIEYVLTDESFRKRLIEHGKIQSTQFSWDASANRAINAMEALVREQAAQYPSSMESQNRLRLAYISPLPPERSGISDYSAELLPALAQYYDIDVVVAQNDVSDEWIKSHCPIRSVEWFVQNSACFDCVLYHFGNSHFHQHMFGLLKSIPGVVVLHDFYLSGIYRYIDVFGYAPNSFIEQLYQSHGYAGLLHGNTKEAVWKYPCSLDVIENSVGTIVHSENSIRLAKKWYGNKTEDFAVIPLLRVAAVKENALEIRKEMGFSDGDFIVCSFGLLGATKLNHRLLTAWLGSALARSNHCYLVFVGENHEGEYCNELLSLIKHNSNGKRVKITGWLEQKVFRDYLTIADLGVQLRTLSRGETSAAILDCMNYGLASIVNSNGSMADLPHDAVWKLSDEFNDQTLIEALETLWQNHEKRFQMGEYAKSVIKDKHNPSYCAEQYQIAIENFYKKNPPVVKNLLDTIAKTPNKPKHDEDLMVIANSIAMTFPQKHIQKTLFVDVSELVQCDVTTDIQRDVCNIVKEWLLHPPAGYRVEPIFEIDSDCYLYARKFTIALLGIAGTVLNDEPVDYVAGDIFIRIDLQNGMIIAHDGFDQKKCNQGLVAKFDIYSKSDDMRLTWQQSAQQLLQVILPKND